MRIDRYRHARHSKTLLQAHVIFVTKYRERLTARGVWERIKHEMYKACTELGVSLAEVEADKDHIHLMIEYPPTLSICRIVRYLKQVTTYRTWRCYGNYLSTVYWHEHTLWSDGYFAASVGEASSETVRQYIRNQV